MQVFPSKNPNVWDFAANEKAPSQAETCKGALLRSRSPFPGQQARGSGDDVNLYHWSRPALLGAVRGAGGGCLGDSVLNHGGGSSCSSSGGHRSHIGGLLQLGGERLTQHDGTGLLFLHPDLSLNPADQVGVQIPIPSKNSPVKEGTTSVKPWRRRSSSMAW